MSGRGKDLLKQAIELPPTERAELIERLFESFDLPSRQSVDEIWGQECEARIDAFDRGEIKASGAKQVFDRIDGTHLP